MITASRAYRVVTVATLLLALPSGGRAQSDTILVCLVRKFSTKQPIIVYAVSPSNNHIISESVVRGVGGAGLGICVLSPMPSTDEVDLFYYINTPSLARTMRMDGNMPWSGPTSIQLTANGPNTPERPPLRQIASQDVVPFQHSAGAGGSHDGSGTLWSNILPAANREGPVVIGDGRARDIGRATARLREELKNIESLAEAQGAFPRDAVYWSLQYLRTIHAGRDRGLIDALEKRLRTGEKSKWMFEGAASKARYELFGKVVRAQQGGPTAPTLAPTELQSVFTEEDALPTARNAALAVHTASGFEMDGETWVLARQYATDSTSPYAYTANLACASSRVPGHQAVVIEGIRQSSDPVRASIAIEAATAARLERARPDILQKASVTQDDSVKVATIDYLGEQSDQESARALNRYLKDDSVSVRALAASRLFSMQQRKVILPADVQQELNAVSSVRLKDLLPDINRSALIRSRDGISRGTDGP